MLFNGKGIWVNVGNSKDIIKTKRSISKSHNIRKDIVNFTGIAWGTKLENVNDIEYLEYYTWAEKKRLI